MAEESQELYKKFRPTKPSELVGQADAMKSLASMFKNDVVPHAILFTGPSGCGKTTIARMLRTKLKCSTFDFQEVNAANFRGIDDIRSIQSQVGAMPLSGDCRIWLIDECHQLTAAAQDAFLKLLEDTPSHVYFFLATTDPQKLKATIKTRCTEVRCLSLTEAELRTLVSRVAELEKVNPPLDEDVVKRIAEVAEGSARKALVILNAVFRLEGKETQLSAINSQDTKATSFELAQLLMKDNASWGAVRALLSALEESEFEGARRVILGYCKACLLKADLARAAMIIEVFRDPLYDIGFPGLVSNCYTIVKG